MKEGYLLLAGGRGSVTWRQAVQVVSQYSSSSSSSKAAFAAAAAVGVVTASYQDRELVTAVFHTRLLTFSL